MLSSLTLVTSQAMSFFSCTLSIGVTQDLKFKGTVITSMGGRAGGGRAGRPVGGGRQSGGWQPGSKAAGGLAGVQAGVQAGARTENAPSFIHCMKTGSEPTGSNPGG